jgi:hypothetical protein
MCNSLCLTFWPHNLISALWLLTADAIAQREHCRRCWVCFDLVGGLVGTSARG